MTKSLEKLKLYHHKLRIARLKQLHFVLKREMEDKILQNKKK